MNFVRPKKRPKLRMGLREDTWYRSRRHCRHTSSHECLISGINGHQCTGRVVAAHDRYKTDGCAGRKPSDFHTFPACDGAHAEQHQIGEAAFEKKYGISIKEWTAAMVRGSPCRREIEEWKRLHPSNGTRRREIR